MHSCAVFVLEQAAISSDGFYERIMGADAHESKAFASGKLRLMDNQKTIIVCITTLAAITIFSVLNGKNSFAGGNSEQQNDGKTRKVIQVATSDVGLFAVTDDGSLWYTDYHSFKGTNVWNIVPVPAPGVWQVVQPR